MIVRKTNRYYKTTKNIMRLILVFLNINNLKLF